MAAKVLLIVVIFITLAGLGSTADLKEEALHCSTFQSFARVTTNTSDIDAASVDYGMQTKAKPRAVLHPTSVYDISKLIKKANRGHGFLVSARGNGHSVNGQSLTSNGVVIDMNMRHHNKVLNETECYMPRVNVEGKYVDVWSGELWIDLLNATLKYGLAPKTWTDYLYLTVGGTLSNAGISGQSYNHGPQISNVYELDVVTGKGDILRCSRDQNRKLFYAVLGGLGQFGIITRVRIPLEPAPERVKWITILYTDFSTFTKDQEYLTSLHDKPSSERFDYVEGFVTYNSSIPDGGILYSLEIVKNYYNSTEKSVDKVVEALLRKLQYIPTSETRHDVPYIEFLDRVHTTELILRAEGLWEVPHPWLNLFIPKSKIAEFNQGVFRGILRNNTNGGPIIVYPLNKNKWEDETSAVTPDEDVFYAVSTLWSASTNATDETNTLSSVTDRNNEILKFCKDANINFKKYLPFYSTSEDWQAHFGPHKWEELSKRKSEYDPKHILASGQQIFNTNLAR